MVHNFIMMEEFLIIRSPECQPSLYILCILLLCHASENITMVVLLKDYQGNSSIIIKLCTI
jgi:hypothetical protein